MSKSDAMRAMREARYAASRSPAATPAAQPSAQPAARVTAARKAPATAAATDEAVPATAPVPDGLCGHRAISGRTCTREQGHAAKSHRYS